MRYIIENPEGKVWALERPTLTKAELARLKRAGYKVLPA